MPRNRGARVKLAVNIFKDDVGIGAFARVPGMTPRELRFKHGTARKTINDALDKKRTQMRSERDSEKAITAPGTVGRLVADYLALLKHEKAKHTAATLLAPWVVAIGARQTDEVKKADILEVILEWEENARVAEDAHQPGARKPKHGYAASSINHRRRELAKAWDAILPDTKNMVRQVRKSKEPDGERRDQPMHVLDAIIDEIADKSTGKAKHMPNKTKARLRAMLWSGFAPKMLMIMPMHGIRLWKEQNGEDGGEVQLPPRKKGKGAPGVTIPLFPEGARAMRGVLRAFAVGKFSQASVWKTFQRAVKRYKATIAKQGLDDTLPPDLKPYDLRHSFLSWVSDTTDDPQLVQFLAQHLSLETTTRYTKSAIERRAARLVRGESAAPARGPAAAKTEATAN